MKVSNKKKILYLVNSFSQHGGIERMLSNKIDAWIEEFNYEVIVVTIQQNNLPIVYPTRNDFQLINLDLNNLQKFNLKKLNLFKNKLNNILKNVRPDIVITTLTGIPSLVLPLISPRIKKILEIHSSGALSVTKTWKYKWSFLNKYHKVVLLNEDEKQYYKLKNIEIIPNFIDIVREEPNTQKKKRIIAAGRIHPDKQYNHLIDIWEIIYKNHPDWVLEIYGDGDKNLQSKLENKIKEKGLKNISFFPATNKLMEVLKNSEIFALTSQTECFPMVLLECKAANVCPISYDSPNGPRHIIINDGILVEHNNIQKFAEELDFLITHPEVRRQFVINAKENYKLFLPSRVINMWNKLI